MSTIVFMGPSLSLREAQALLDAEYFGPASHGDVYRAATRRRRPDAIVLIDGRFESVPAVRHREILWALKEGIPVIGASSIGALRACELDEFGMSGFGSVYEAYRDGIIEGDDEVALEHGPAEVGYLPLSVPLVNVRASFAQARKEAILDEESERQLLRLAKRIFYKDRTYERLLAEAGNQNIAQARLANLAAWLPRGSVDQKREDARNLLKALAADPAATAPTRQTRFHMNYVDIWELDVASMEATAQTDDEIEILPLRAILDELGLEPGAYKKICDHALRIALAKREIRRGSPSQRVQSSPEAEKLLRDTLAITNSRALQRWLIDNDLDDGGYHELVRLHAETEHLRATMKGLIEGHIMSALQLEGRYSGLAKRAREKKLRLDDDRGANPPSEGTIPPRFQLAQWYFGEVLSRLVPDDLDVYAREQGFVDAATFMRALNREYQFVAEGQR